MSLRGAVSATTSPITRESSEQHSRPKEQELITSEHIRLYAWFQSTEFGNRRIHWSSRRRGKGHIEVWAGVYGASNGLLSGREDTPFPRLVVDGGLLGPTTWEV